MKISIITVSLNNASTIEETMRSVLCQDYPYTEYILIDGGSTDGTLDIIDRCRSRIAHVISEPDEGIYDAMNKGISLSTGDIIGFLHADDIYPSNDVLSRVAEAFEKNGVDSVFGDLVYADRQNLDKIVRYYSANDFSIDRLSHGCMPPHPAFFVGRKCYECYGAFKTDYQIAADYELVARFLVRHRITFSYIPHILVKMRMGGISTRSLKSTWILNKEILRACAENNIKTNYLKVYMKYFTKIGQLFKRPV